MKLMYCIKMDLSRKVSEISVKSFFKEYFSFQGMCFRIVFWLRIVQFTKKNAFSKYTIGIPAILMFHRLEKKYGVYINTNIFIGPGLSIVHPGGVFINASSIGENFTILQNVTIGSKPGCENLPVIGDDVSIFVGSVVCGDITLGDRVCIGANSYVDKSIPSDTVVRGTPKY